MATITFTYESKCPGDHLSFAINVNGVKRRTLLTTGAELRTASLTADQADAVAEWYLNAIARKFYRDNPNATLAQARAFLEAQEIVI